MERIDKSLITASAAQLHLSPTLEINELVQKARSEGKSVVHLGFGEATFPIQKEVLAIHETSARSTSYMPVAGSEGLRVVSFGSETSYTIADLYVLAIAEYNTRRLGIQIDPDQVVVAPGSKPLLFALFDVLHGDVLLPRPSWVSYEPQVQHANKRLFWVETDEHDRHTITDDALESAYNKAVAAGSRPRVMLVNSPSNPTGQVFSLATIHTITKFCKDKSITLISDEIYSDLAFDQKAVAQSPYRKYIESQSKEDTLLETAPVIMTGGLSKTYSAGGWRIGYAIFPASTNGTALRRTILAYTSECWSAASAPAQYASIKAFSTSEDMDQYRKTVSRLHQQCTTKLYNALQTLGLDVAQPHGGFYVYPSFQPYAAHFSALGIKTSVQLSKWLITECGIAALPGSAFGEDDHGLPGGRFRLRMATSYLYFKDENQRYRKGYELLEASLTTKKVALPLLDSAIVALEAAVLKLRRVEI